MPEHTSLVAAIREHAKNTPDKTALVFLFPDRPPQDATYAQLHADAKRYARALHDLGVEPGGLVILALDHSYELVAAFIGAMYLRAVPSIFPYLAPHADLETHLQRIKNLVVFSDAQAVIAAGRLKEGLTALLSETPCRILDIQSVPTDAAGDEAPFDLPLPSSEDMAPLQFTSGTTGLPKGIVFSHQAVINCARSFASYFRFTADDVSVNWAPPHHAMGLTMALFLPLATGAKSVLISPFHWMSSPHILFQAIHTYRGVMNFMANFALNHCVRAIRDQDLQGVDLSSWRILGCGSEPIQTETLQRFAERFAPYGFRRQALKAAYGLSENPTTVMTPMDREVDVDWVSLAALTSHRATPAPPHAPGAKPIVSCGYLLPGVEIRILDDSGADLPDRCVGEVIVRSSALFSGYYRQPDLTAQTLRDGWLYTGDLGYMADGQLYICGRKKDLIIVGGRNIYPHNIENIAQAILGHDAPVAAFGVPAETLGTEAPVLVCELRRPLPDEERDRLSRAIRQQTFRELGVALKDVRFVEEKWIVRTPSGKIARPANCQKYLDQFGKETPAPPAPLAPQELPAQLRQLVENTLRVHPIGLHDNLFHLGLDSLRFLGLLLQIEELIGKPLPIETLAHTATIAQMADALAPLVGTCPAPLDEMSGGKPTAPARKTRWYPRRAIAQLAAALLPYPSGSRLAAWLCRQPWLHNTLFRRRVRLIRRFFRLIERPVPSESQAVSLGLIKHFWPEWRCAALARLPDDQFHRWFAVEGLEALRQALAQGRGLILAHSHTAYRGLLSLALDRHGFTVPMTGVGETNTGFFQKIRLRRNRKTDPAARYTRQLYTARQTLRQGGCVLIAPDGYQGQSREIVCSFHGRRRPFRTGFASLAVDAGAPVFAAAISMDAQGKVAVAFRPLQIEPGLDGEEAVTALTRQYVAFLGERWAQEPESVWLRYMAKHIALPPAEPET